MRSRSLKRLALLVALALAPLAAAPPAFASGPPGHASQLSADAGPVPRTSAALTTHRLAELGQALRRGPAARDSVASAYGERVTGATAAAGGLAATICAALGPETGGVGCIAAGGLGVTIVAIVAAHGVCPDGQNYRIYILSMEGQCRDD